MITLLQSYFFLLIRAKLIPVEAESQSDPNTPSWLIKILEVQKPQPPPQPCVKKETLLEILSCGLVLMCFPFLVTHSVPGLFLFVYPFFSTIIFYKSIMLCSSKYLNEWLVACQERHCFSQGWTSGSNKLALFLILFIWIVEKMSMVALIIVLQTASNYTFLFYSGSFPWKKVFEVEWNLRNTNCYLQTIFQDVSTTWGFLSYVF